VNVLAAVTRSQPACPQLRPVHGIALHCVRMLCQRPQVNPGSATQPFVYASAYERINVVVCERIGLCSTPLHVRAALRAKSRS
jgi:hypothetical protein